MRDVEQELQRILEERVRPQTVRPPALPAHSRRAIRRRRATLVLAGVGVAVAAVAAASTLDRTPPRSDPAPPQIAAPAPSPRPATGTNHERVWDGDVAFDLFRVDCGHGPVGDQDSDLDPDGSFCIMGLSVVNESDRDVLVSDSRHVLTAGGRRFPPWERGMAELAADDQGSPLTTPVPPGGAASLSLIFEYPSSLEPERVEVHASQGSSGAVILLEHCSWNHHEGVVSGGCYRAPPKPELGVRYPHSISTYAGETASMLQVSCFDSREWAVVSVPPTPVPEGFLGQGVIELETRDRAIFTDNSGIVLTLEPTALNEDDPGVCG